MSSVHQLYAPVILYTFLGFQCNGKTKWLSLYTASLPLKSAHKRSCVTLPSSIIPSSSSELHGLQLQSEINLLYGTEMASVTKFQ
jgi:hypothetical protein